MIPALLLKVTLETKNQLCGNSLPEQIQIYDKIYVGCAVGVNAQVGGVLGALVAVGDLLLSEQMTPRVVFPHLVICAQLCFPHFKCPQCHCVFEDRTCC